jgi:hypothetical protein
MLKVSLEPGSSKGKQTTPFVIETHTVFANRREYDWAVVYSYYVRFEVLLKVIHPY